MDWLWGVVVFVAGAVITYGIKHIWDRHLEKKKTQPRIICMPSCHPFLNEYAVHTNHTVELLVDGESTTNAALFFFRIKNESQVIARNVKIRIALASGVTLLRYMFLVDQDVICERLQTDDGYSPPRFTWEYINPRQTIDLEVVVSPYTGVEDVTLELDGEYLAIESRKVKTNCPVPSC